MLNTRVLLKMIALFVMGQGCQQAAPPESTFGPWQYKSRRCSVGQVETALTWNKQLLLLLLQ